MEVNTELRYLKSFNSLVKMLSAQERQERKRKLKSNKIVINGFSRVSFQLNFWKAILYLIHLSIEFLFFKRYTSCLVTATVSCVR